MQEKLSELEIVRREKLNKLRELGVDPYGTRFDVSDSFIKIREFAKDKSHEELESLDKQVSTAGRVLTIRDQGKVAFVTLQDQDSTIQLYIRKDVVSELSWSIFSLLDLGDIIGVKGRVMLTRTLEPTIRVTSITLLSKSLKPLPEKFHGLVDVDERFRHRYLDLICNKKSKFIALLRAKVIRAMQRYLDDLGFVEVETSMLESFTSGAAARPFVTHLNALNQDYFLRIATEINLKKLIVGGIEKVYEIGRIFRNEGMDNRHNPEFTTLELYESYSDLDGMMDLVENMIKNIATVTLNSTIIPFNDTTLDLGKRYRRVAMVDLILEHTGIDFRKDYSMEEMIKLAKDHEIKLEKHFKFGHIVNTFFEKYVEEKLIEPTFVTNHPIDVTPLAKKSIDPRFALRFELFIDGREYANAYSELNDPIEQEERLRHQLEEKKLGNNEASDLDVDFIEALQYGMPPCGGLGIGIDRLIMLLTNEHTITEVILFPLLKPRN